MRKIVEDIGILASTDPVAVDKAALDLVEKKSGRKLDELVGNANIETNCQIKHGESIGLGSSHYELIEID